MAPTLPGKATALGKAVLFITYDGLLDPLGGSQILPYLRGIAAHPRPLHILSFEKPERLAQGQATLRADLAAAGIGWTALGFTRRGGKAGKLWDLARMYGMALLLQLRLRFGIVHCRSYQAMQVGCLIKRLFGAKTVFDMRGLWVDDRVDGGIWKLGRIPDRWIYSAYKTIEKRLLECATHVIALTERVVPELAAIAPRMTAPVTVIPCCADFDHYVPPTAQQCAATKSGLGIPPGARVISYLGSLGTWYLLEDMLRFFAAACARWPDAHFLLITRDWGQEAEALVERLGLGALRPRMHVRPAERAEVPALLACSTVMLSFRMCSYSQLACSPTKLAEAFAVGVPAICNGGIGDVDASIAELRAGAVVELDDPRSVAQAIDRLDEIAGMGGAALRERARARLGLEVAAAAYRRVYDRLEQTP